MRWAVEGAAVRLSSNMTPQHVADSLRALVTLEWEAGQHAMLLAHERHAMLQDPDALDGAAVSPFHLYSDGLSRVGVPQTDREAARWYRQEAEYCEHAQLIVAHSYANGWGVPQDDAEAARWYQEAAQQGHASSQFYLGLCYATGTGVSQDDDEAARLIRMAALQGHANAQNELGEMYRCGKGVPIDAAEAARWYWLAVWQRHTAACLNLGILMSLPQAALQKQLAQRTITSYFAKGLTLSIPTVSKKKTNLAIDPRIPRLTCVTSRLGARCGTPFISGGGRLPWLHIFGSAPSYGGLQA
jgi:TPR repeat protein